MVIGAVAAGTSCGGGVFAVGCRSRGFELAGWVARVRAPLTSASRFARIRRWMSRAIERAGWRETPQRVAALAFAFAFALAVVASALSAVLALSAFAGGCVAFFVVLNSAIARRRRRLSGELVPVLELFTLELSGGGSALSALGSVSVQVESELALDLRRMLIVSQVAGSASFEARLLEYSDRLDLPALASLATILAASRDYGTAASQGVRALATDLRRAQRRELIAQSRRALNNVLLPAAVAVLLPFLGILMFPAVSVLQASLR